MMFRRYTFVKPSAVIGAAVFAAVIVQAAPGTTAGWPGTDFVMKTDDKEVSDPAAANSQRATVVDEIESAAIYFDSLGFSLPRLFPRDETFKGQAGQTLPYEVWVVDSLEMIGPGTIAAYSHDTCKSLDFIDNSGKIRVSLEGMKGQSTTLIHRSVAHELNHAVHFQSPFASGCGSSRWLREATAEGAGFMSAYERDGSVAGLASAMKAKMRSYADPFRPTEAQAGGVIPLALNGYDTGQFFFWAGLRYGGAGYLSHLYRRGFAKVDGESGAQAAKRDIKWIDEGMASAPQVKTGLDFLFPQFIADYGSWGQNFAPGIASQQDWMDKVFGGACDYMKLSPGNPFLSREFKLEPIAAKCVIVHVDNSFPAFVALDAFAYVKGGDQFQRLDSIHLSTILRADAAGTVDPCEANSRSAKARTWPVCVVKPYLYGRESSKPDIGDAGMYLTRSYDEASELTEPDTIASVAEGTKFVRFWEPQDHIYDQPGMIMVFALSNVAPRATSTHGDTIQFVVGVRSTKRASKTAALGIPQLIDPTAVPAGMSEFAGEMKARAGSGDDISPAAAAAAVGDFERGYAEYGITGYVSMPDHHAVAMRIPVEGAGSGGVPGAPVSGYTVVLRNLPPLGETGTAKAVVSYSDKSILATPGTCKDRKKFVEARILQSGIEGVRFAISTPMVGVDVFNPAAGCIPSETFDAEVTIPFGWPFDSMTVPHHVVTPGIHAYVERYLGWHTEQGIPAASIGPFPGWSAEITGSPPATAVSNPSGSGGSAAGGQVACDCSCPALNALMAGLDSMTIADKSAMQPADIAKMSTCVQSCMSELMACKMAEQN